MEEQSQVEELQKNLQEQGSKADDVSNDMVVLHSWWITPIAVEMLATTTESQIPTIAHLNKDGLQDCSTPVLLKAQGLGILL